MAKPRDPYRTLGVSPTATDAVVRTAYRRLVQLHHPDHNDGSKDSARRFEEVQEAYAEVQRLRAAGGRAGPRAASSQQSTGANASESDLAARIAAMERQVREAQEARRRAREEAQRAARAAREAAAQRPGRPSDDELGYIHTDDTFSKIFSDFRSQLSGLYQEAKEMPVTDRVADLLDDVASKLKKE